MNWQIILPMKISIIGIGYVGAVSAACLAGSGHHVIAVDQNETRVNCLNDGHAPIIEKGLDEKIARARNAETLEATTDIDYAIANTDITLICVGTPSLPDGSLDLSHVEQACLQIGQAIAKKDSYHSVVLRSTVIPGTGQNLAIPTLEKSGIKLGRNFGFGSNPEFLRESTAVYDYFNPSKIVLGASDERTMQAILQLYYDIEAPRAIATIEVAEAVKYADNSWHALKVGFANEIGNVFKEHGVDSHKVMEIFFLDTKLNLSRQYLMPGFAFGGSCLPKDVRAIRAAAGKVNVKTPLLDGLLEANDNQVERAHQMIARGKYRKVALMGLAFKSGTDDIRESPLLNLAHKLVADGCEVYIYDPSISKALAMKGRSSFPAIVSDNIVDASDERFIDSDAFIIGNTDHNYVEILLGIDEEKAIIDLVRLKHSERLEMRPYYSGICW